VHDDGALAAKFREVRHGLRRAASLIPGGAAALVAARDSRGDVGRNAPPVNSAESRNSLAANIKRAQEAMRVLEELSKASGAAASSKFGELRFRLYDLEREAAKYIYIEEGPRPIPQGPFLYAIGGYGELNADGAFGLLNELFAARTGMIQLRDKDCEDKIRLSRAAETAELFAGRESLFVVNDRVDIALAAGADAAHLGQDDMPVAAARGIAGGKIRIGFSTHSYAQAMDGLQQEPDYLAVGPVFASRTKPGGKPVTPKLVGRVVAKAGKIPVVAIGGVTPENMSEVFDAGASGAAMISAITESKNPKAALKKINGILAAKKAPSR
jgi:thiamine-phosphate pyrophosphorylase